MRPKRNGKLMCLEQRDEIPGIERRRFLARATSGFVALAGLMIGLPSWADRTIRPPVIQRPRDASHLTDFERLHVPLIRMPEMIEDGANAPCFIEMDHPMDPDHYITSVQILDYEDPIIWKGTWHFTPASGRVYVYTQLRLDSGPSTVYVIAACNQHGPWVGSANVNVAVGGC